MLFSNHIVLIVGILVCYLTTLTAVNFYLQNCNNSYIKTLTIALSASASDNSGWLFLGLPGAAYVLGLSQIWIVIGLGLGYYLNWQIVSPYLQKKLNRLNPDVTILLRNEFPIYGYLIQTLISWIIIFFSTLYISANLVSLSLLFSHFNIINYDYALLGTAIFITIYVSISSFEGVQSGDIIQAIMMLVASIGIMSIGLYHVNWLELISSKVNIPSLFNMSWLQFLSLVSWGLGYFGQPHILTKFIFLKDTNMTKYAKWISLGCSVTCWTATLVAGLIGSLLLPNLINAEMVFITTAQTFLNPLLISGIFIAINAAIISTVTTQVLVTAQILHNQIFSNNLTLCPSPRNDAKSFKESCISQQTISYCLGYVIIGLMSLSTLLAYNYQGTVLSLVAYAWAGLGITLGPVMLLLSLNWKLSEKGTLASISLGLIISILWHYLNLDQYLYEMLPIFSLITLSLVLTSKYNI